MYYTVLQYAIDCHCLIRTINSFDMYYVINMYHVIVLSSAICTVIKSYCLENNALRIALGYCRLVIATADL